MSIIKNFFQDKNLGNEVEKLILSHSSSMRTINETTSLDLSGRSIQSLEGIQLFENLERLQVFENQIEDLSPLSNLRKLNTLHLAKNQIEDLSPLAELPQLQTLTLNKNPIKDISVLKDLKNLKSLLLAHTEVTNLSFLKEFENLQKLCLSCECDLTTLPMLEHLEFLLISKEFSDLTINSDLIIYSDSEKLSNVNKLNVFLKHCKNLEDYSFVNNLPNLKELRLPKIWKEV